MNRDGPPEGTFEDDEFTVDLRCVKDVEWWHAQVASMEPEIRKHAIDDEAAEIILRRLRGRRMGP